MKKTISGFILFMVLLLAGFARASDTPFEFSDRVFRDHINSVLMFKIAAVEKCTSHSSNNALWTHYRNLLKFKAFYQTKSYADYYDSGMSCEKFEQAVPALQNYYSANRLFESGQRRNPYGDQIIQTLTLLKATEHFRFLCESELNESDAAFATAQRQKFAELKKVTTEVATHFGDKIDSSLRLVWDDVDPICISTVSSDYSSGGDKAYTDRNPCVGFHKVSVDVLKDAFGSTYNYLRALADFAVFLDGEMKRTQADQGTEIETADFAKQLQEKYNIADKDLHQTLIAILNYFTYSGKSGLGYVDGLGDLFWRDLLYKENAIPVRVLNLYDTQKRVVDYWVYFRRELGQRKLHLKLFGEDITRYSRHEMISVLMACHYKQEGRPLLASMAPKAAGYAYEAKDFVSHLFYEGVSLKASIQNFQQDTQKHIRGANLGLQLCSQEN